MHNKGSIRSGEAKSVLKTSGFYLCKALTLKHR